jgi:hypothetical protein
MCPACLTTAALILGGATSTGGLTALVVKKLRAEIGANSPNPTTEFKGDRDESANSRVAR